MKSIEFINKMYVLTESLSFEIADSELPNKMTFSEALDSAIEIGDRWRLPTIEELNQMHRLHRKAVGNFKNEAYWSSESISNRSFKAINFLTGGQYQGVGIKAPDPKYWVRLVRNI